MGQDDLKWYLVHTYSGHEDKVRASIEKSVSIKAMKDRVAQVVIPTEEVIELKKNKKQIRRRKFFPGYILIQMIADNDTCFLVRSTPGVTGFLGGARPVPLQAADVERMMELNATPKTAKPRPAVVFDKGENVRINDGPFRHFVGTVEEVNEDRAKLKVTVSIFGRATPVELDYLQVEKV
ncbi:MAG: transcription termination/antitermination protein NusG [Elusimicrobia bacterium]|nr:transcription termination/antitermination protein NusG [Candidatus Obscuribacterium magneticum]